jgi:hypothetical protein
MIFLFDNNQNSRVGIEVFFEVTISHSEARHARDFGFGTTNKQFKTDAEFLVSLGSFLSRHIMVPRVGNSLCLASHISSTFSLHRRALVI